MFRKIGTIAFVVHQWENIKHPTFFAKFLVDQVELTLTDGSRNPSWRQQKSIEGSVWICLNDFLEGTDLFPRNNHTPLGGVRAFCTHGTWTCAD